ncbi:proline dehydrogenase family protein [Bacillus halotolerans]|uniref:proline dehydrogenase n=1 Tax=Bacillus halotolerans TaxID=260554 RepID=A0ABY7HYA2_9BACI|nr:proline dehydrogenase [Bacillus halotolerans]MDG0765020.1 proline dehydrogenase [Bacillus halotolerans]MDG3072927.1 proline dehydrogenase [Bacillus halotolerans]UUI83618.1 proline dehydrogenase [Bacillus halotolerans]UYO31310.1 proline dehydrogenase [Bacillus halotolerans]WAT20643.1 proline dehydrogenase [Bacillus halotolerans]
MLRHMFLFLSQNKTLTKLAKVYGSRLGARRFVAGDTIEAAVRTIKKLNQSGLCTTIDYLGEYAATQKEASRVAEECKKAIQAIADHRLDSGLSLKLTSLGLDISEELAVSHLRDILSAAKENDVAVTIDMEDYSHYEQTLAIYRQCKQEFDMLGTVIQAYLYRAAEDIRKLHDLKPNLRLVKGAYKESAAVAFPDKKGTDLHFQSLIKLHLLSGNYTAVATHDDDIIAFTKKLVAEHQIPLSQFEFQMLYGIRPERQKELVKEGYKMRVYVPYGTDWFSYFMRRIAERPANAAFVLKGIFKK